MVLIVVILFIGFFGVGKIIFLCYIFNEQYGFKIVVIENEFGEVFVDDQFIGDCVMQIKILINGCICCICFNELEDVLFDFFDSCDCGEIEFDWLVIECIGMVDLGLIIQIFFFYQVFCECYLLDGVIVLVDVVYVDQQMDQFIIVQLQVGYVDWILLIKIDVVGDIEKLCEWLVCINVWVLIYIVIYGDIDLSQLFNISGFMLEEKVVSVILCFYFVVEKQNDVLLIVVEFDYLVDISEVLWVMENLLFFFVE